MLPVRTFLLAYRAPKVPKAPKVQLGHKALPALKVHKAPKVLRVPRVHKGHRGTLALKVPQVPKVLLGHKVLPVPREMWVHRVHKEQQDLKARKGQ